MKELKRVWHDLPRTQNEVELIASILNTGPQLGRQGIEAEAMKRMSSVGLIDIAAHGNKLTEEIFLFPNSRWTSQFPEKEDYILKISDVQATNLRANLVVWSCSHSGRGRILNGGAKVQVTGHCFTNTESIVKHL